jgi:hypothetical protein
VFVTKETDGTLNVCIMKIIGHSRTGAEYELPRQYLSKESQPLYREEKMF